MERRGYVKIATDLPTTVEPGVGGTGISIDRRELNAIYRSRKSSPPPPPIDKNLVRQRLVTYLRNKPDTSTPADLQPINAVCIPEAMNTYPSLFDTDTETQIRD